MKTKQSEQAQFKSAEEILEKPTRAMNRLEKFTMKLVEEISELNASIDHWQLDRDKLLDKNRKLQEEMKQSADLVGKLNSTNAAYLELRTKDAETIKELKQQLSSLK